MPKHNNISIGQLAKQFNLSRSTLLYYERIGLLVASSRTTAGYRLYSAEDVGKLESILLYRSTGLPLKQLKRFVQAKPNQAENKPSQQILEQRLSQINADIDDLRAQQRVLIDLLHSGRATGLGKKMDKHLWSEMLRQAGLNEQGMQEWHRQFEQRAPLEHHKFLASLGLDSAEIKSIRQKSKNS